MAVTETTTLLSSSSEAEHNGGLHDRPSMSASASLLSKIFMGAQLFLLLFFWCGTTYSDNPYDVKEYIAFRDIMAMLLLGFGYLMTFLKNYGLGAVGFTMMLSILAIQLNMPLELGMRFLKGEDGEDTAWPMPLGLATFIDGEFAAATLMISFGALIGTASPLQMMLIGISQSVFYALNKVFFVFGMLGAEDVGGSMTIHCFGAYFGLAASKALGGAKDVGGAAPEPDKVSDIFALIGTTILWVFWPSFVGATKTGTSELTIPFAPSWGRFSILLN